MEIQLQIYLILGVGGFLIAALILSNSLLIYYLSKLYRKLSDSKENYQDRNIEEPQQNNGFSNNSGTSYNNPSMDFEEELNRRFTQYTPDTTMQRDNTKANKGTDNSQNIKNVSEEFRWKKTESRQVNGSESQYNSNIVLRSSLNDHDDFKKEFTMFAVRQIKNLLTHSAANDVRLPQVNVRTILNRPRLRNPIWFLKKERSLKNNEYVTPENKEFVKEMVHEKFGKAVIVKGLTTYENTSSLLKTETLAPVEWKPQYRRTGVIARKLGHSPLWLKDGSRIITTMLQVVDNHVIKYIPPGMFKPTMKKPLMSYSSYGCILVGSESIDPNLLTSNYMGLFKNSGVMPKRNLSRFIVSPQAALLPGTQLNATHFKVGDFVDVRGKTVDHGFQGVMKRWGFKGQPASHGQTKTHRRPGAIGGGIKHRVWPGKKMPGHMGNRWRLAKGLKIWRINTKTNTIWVSGPGVPGDPNGLCYIYDSILPLRLPKQPYFPTFTGNEADLPEDIYADDVHQFTDPTILFEPEK